MSYFYSKGSENNWIDQINQRLFWNNFKGYQKSVFRFFWTNFIFGPKPISASILPPYAPPWPYPPLETPPLGLMVIACAVGHEFFTYWKRPFQKWKWNKGWGCLFMYYPNPQKFFPKIREYCDDDLYPWCSRVKNIGFNITKTLNRPKNICLKISKSLIFRIILFFLFWAWRRKWFYCAFNITKDLGWPNFSSTFSVLFILTNYL